MQLVMLTQAHQHSSCNRRCSWRLLGQELLHTDRKQKEQAEMVEEVVIKVKAVAVAKGQELPCGVIATVTVAVTVVMVVVMMMMAVVVVEVAEVVLVREIVLVSAGRWTYCLRTRLLCLRMRHA